MCVGLDGRGVGAHREAVVRPLRLPRTKPQDPGARKLGGPGLTALCSPPSALPLVPSQGLLLICPGGLVWSAQDGLPMTLVASSSEPFSKSSREER